MSSFFPLQPASSSIQSEASRPFGTRGLGMLNFWSQRVAVQGLENNGSSSLAAACQNPKTTEASILKPETLKP